MESVYQEWLKREKKKESKKRNKKKKKDREVVEKEKAPKQWEAISKIVFIVIISAGFWLALRGAFSRNLLTFIIGGVVVFFGGVYLKKGVFIVPPERRLVVEMLGKFLGVRGPGICWILPGLMKVRAVPRIWERPIKLFPENPRIDFKQGGTARLVEPVVWARPLQKDLDRSLFLAVYSVEDVLAAIREEVETALRAYLGELTVEEVFKKVTEGDWLKQVLSKFPEVTKVIESWGFEVTRLTISDFAWDKEVVKTREQVFESQRRVKMQQFASEAAKFEALKEALLTGGTHSEIVKILRENGFSQKEADQIARLYILYKKGADTGSLIDIRTGGSDLASIAGQVIAAIEAVKKKMKE